MNEKIQCVKMNFNKIKEIRSQVIYWFNALEIKITKLKNTTNDFVKTNKDNMFVFGLDSFQFQGKLIDYEYNDMQKFYFALNNRLYCEYYKLYKLILQYTEETIGTNKNIEMLKSTTLFPIYKDLEPFKQYNFEIIEEIHKTIINLLNNLNEHIIAKETQLQSFQLKQLSGLNINNFVNTFDFDVIVIRQKGILYLSYLDFFHTIHTKHFKRFSKKIKLMNDYLDEDIKFDEGLRNREDDSIKSSISNSSLDSIDLSSFTPIKSDTFVDNKISEKMLLKSNVTKDMNSFNIFKHVTTSLSEQNISVTIDETDEIDLHNTIIEKVFDDDDDVVVNSNSIILESLFDTINKIAVKEIPEIITTNELEDGDDKDDEYTDHDDKDDSKEINPTATATATSTAKRKRNKKKKK
jgi:hypothetical protein